MFLTHQTIDFCLAARSSARCRFLAQFAQQMRKKKESRKTQFELEFADEYSLKTQISRLFSRFSSYPNLKDMNKVL